MMVPSENSSRYEETDADRRQGILADNALSLDLVSAFAGDRQLTEAEKNTLDDLKKSRGLRFFPDLLYSITHQYFPPEVAEDLWTEILRHENALSTVLTRNVRIAVAAHKREELGREDCFKLKADKILVGSQSCIEKSMVPSEHVKAVKND